MSSPDAGPPRDPLTGLPMAALANPSQSQTGFQTPNSQTSTSNSNHDNDYDSDEDDYESEDEDNDLFVVGAVPSSRSAAAPATSAATPSRSTASPSRSAAPRTLQDFRQQLHDGIATTLALKEEGFTMAFEIEVALKIEGFATLYEEGADLALFGVETHEDHDLLEEKPMEMKDWPHPGAYLILFKWKVKDDERPIWCLLPPGHRAKYNGQSGSNVRARWYHHLADALADIPKSRKAQAAKLADDMTGIVLYKFSKAAAHAKRALELIPELAQALAPNGVTDYVPTVKEVNAAIMLTVEALHGTIFRTNQAHPGFVLFLNDRLGPSTDVIGVNTMLCLSSSQLTSKNRRQAKKVPQPPQPPHIRQKGIIDAMKGARIHAKIGPTHKTSFSLMLPCALMGEHNALLLSKANRDELGITPSTLKSGAEVYLVERTGEQAPAVMGTFDDARVLAKHAVMIRMGGRETELLHHRGLFVSGSTSRFLKLIGQHAGLAPLKNIQREDLSPFDLPAQALPGGRSNPEHPCSLAMGTYREAVSLHRGSWKTIIHGKNLKKKPLVVPPPPAHLAKEAAKGVLLDVVLAYDVDRDAVPYTYVRRDDKRPVTRAHGFILRRPRHLQEAIIRCRARLGLPELEKDWSLVRKKPPQVQVDLALAGIFPLRISPTEPSPTVWICGERINAPRYLVRALDGEGILTFRIDYETEQLLWWDADAEEEVVHEGKAGDRAVDAWKKAIDARIAAGEDIVFRSQPVFLDEEDDEEEDDDEGNDGSALSGDEEDGCESEAGFNGDEDGDGVGDKDEDSGEDVDGDDEGEKMDVGGTSDEDDGDGAPRLARPRKRSLAAIYDSDDEADG